jgi:hypothetical protein
MAAPCGKGFISHTGEKERDRSQMASAMAMEREERWKRMKEMVRETNERVRGWGRYRKRETERRSSDASMVTARPIGRHGRQRNSVGCQRRYPREGLGR